MSLFGELQVRLDPWQVDYGAELPLDDVEPGPDDAAILDVELAAADWRPVIPGETLAPPRMLFVDGVRRISTADRPARRGALPWSVRGYAVGAVGVDGMASQPTARGPSGCNRFRRSLLSSVTVVQGEVPPGEHVGYRRTPL